MSARRIRRDREQGSRRDARRAGRLSKRTAAAAGLVAGAAAVFAPAANADTFTVNSLDDPGDGTCDGTECTLREAVDEANSASGADTITFASGLSGQITLTDRIEILEGVDIQGPGADVLAVSGDDAYQIFYADTSVNGDPREPVSISGLTLRHGYYSDAGGAIYAHHTDLGLTDMVFTDNYSDSEGGAVYVDSSPLTISGSTFTGNESSDAAGAVYTDGDYSSDPGDDAVITDSTFTDNIAAGNGGAAYFDDTTGGDVVLQGLTVTDNEAEGTGGGLLFYGPEGNVEVRDSIVSGNAAGPDREDDGGGIDFANETLGSVLISNTTISDNTTGGGGGGLYTDSTIDGDLTITGSTISNNSAYYGYGGGAYINEVGGNILIEGSTVSGNYATYDGGGIYFGYLYEDQTTQIRNSTVVDNEAGANPGAFPNEYGGGGIYLYDDSEDTTDPVAENGPVTISSTIVANNSGADFGNDLAQGSFADGFAVDHSLIKDTADARIDDAGNNIFGADPELGPLADNGGPTQTFLPNLTSPVLDAGVANGLTTDQRGLPRTFDAVAIANKNGSDGTDIGSTELQPGENGLPGNGECQGAAVPSKTGTDGPDAITGTEGPDALFGAGGDDTLSALGGNDCVNGDAGEDSADGGAGNDLVSGGEGNDKLNGRAGKDAVKGEAGKDRLSGSGGKDKLKGAAGKDKLNGGGGKDKASGGAGKDTVKGGPGKDKLKGNGGKDKLNAADGKADKVNCGGGKDKATVDAKDKVSNNCDVVKVKG